MNTLELLQIKVKDVMTKNVVSVLEDDTMQEVCDIITSSKVHHIPVTDEENYLKGIVTRMDVELLKDWATNLDLRTAKNANKQVMRSQTAGQRMTKKLATVGPEDTLETCADIFRENLFHCLPVVENGILIGLITSYDLMNIAYRRSSLKVNS